MQGQDSVPVPLEWCSMQGAEAENISRLLMITASRQRTGVFLNTSSVTVLRRAQNEMEMA